jgi:hypothetical protein
MTVNVSARVPSKGQLHTCLRVSTPKHGKGASLLTQREAIARYAKRQQLAEGGPFSGKSGNHFRWEGRWPPCSQVDRSARNLKNWARSRRTHRPRRARPLRGCRHGSSLTKRSLPLITLAICGGSPPRYAETVRGRPHGLLIFANERIRVCNTGHKMITR